MRSRWDAWDSHAAALPFVFESRVRRPGVLTPSPPSFKLRSQRPQTKHLEIHRSCRPPNSSVVHLLGETFRFVKSQGNQEDRNE